ncbi:MAG TPA: DNA polymerase III subunit beta [Dehalococcoidales bacterium]|nr:DNA polymerase III subunit beta [Dehalococcoidales bacterium]
MEIRVEQLRNALEILKPAVPRNPTLPILKNILVKDGQLMATTLESMIVIDMPEADESFLLPYAEVLKMLKYVPGYEKLQIHSESGKLTLSWSDGEGTYPVENIKGFPIIPELKIKDEADINGDAFIPALASALPYVARDEGRPVLTGITVQFGRPIEISAGDGFRMAHIVLPFGFPAEYTTVIPAGAISTLIHVMAKTPRTPPQGEALVDILTAKRQVHVALDGKLGMIVRFTPNVKVIVRLVDGSPPAWLKLIPKDEPILRVQFFAREMETAVRRVGDVASKNKGIVRFEFQAGACRVSAKADGREVSAKVSALDMLGAPNRIALNQGYLTEYLKEKDSIVTMMWTGGAAPASFHHPSSPNVLIMPMQTSWGDEPAAEQEKPAADVAAAEESAAAAAGPEEPEAAAAAAETAAAAAPEASAPKPKKGGGKKVKK